VSEVEPTPTPAPAPDAAARKLDPLWGAEASPPTFGRLLAYRIVWFFVYSFCRLAWRVRIHGRERLPRTGGYVVAPTHRSGWDIPFSSMITARRVRFMGKGSVFRVPVLGPALRYLGGFGIERGTPDRRALQALLECLQGGEPVVMYPEGTRHVGDRVGELYDGAAWVAARAEVPIVPVAIAGSEGILRSGRKLPRFPTVVIVIGDPVPAVPRDGRAVPRTRVRELTARLQEHLQAAFDEANARRDG
jgi:1-acyl-sn-glycerol-3-phosphate acyltransferase